MTEHALPPGAKLCLVALLTLLAGGPWACKRQQASSRVASADDASAELDPYAEAVDAAANVEQEYGDLQLLNQAETPSGLGLTDTEPLSPEEQLQRELESKKDVQDRAFDEQKRKLAKEKELKDRSDALAAEVATAAKTMADLNNNRDKLCVIGEEPAGCRCQASGVVATSPNETLVGQKVESEATLLLPTRADTLFSDDNKATARQYPSISLAPLLSRQVYNQTCRAAIQGLKAKAGGGNVSTTLQKRTIGDATTDEACLCETTKPPKIEVTGGSTPNPEQSLYAAANRPIMKMACMQPYRLVATLDINIKRRPADFIYGTSVAYVSGRADWRYGGFEEMRDIGCNFLEKRWEQDCQAEAGGFSAKNFPKTCDGKMPVNILTPEKDPARRGCSCTLYDPLYEQSLMRRRLKDFEKFDQTAESLVKGQKELSKLASAVEDVRLARTAVENQMVKTNPAVKAGLIDHQPDFDYAKFRALREKMDDLESNILNVMNHNSNFRSVQMFTSSNLISLYGIRSRPSIDPFFPGSHKGRPTLIVLKNTLWSEVGALTRPHPLGQPRTKPADWSIRQVARNDAVIQPLSELDRQEGGLEQTYLKTFDAVSDTLTVDTTAYALDRCLQVAYPDPKQFPCKGDDAGQVIPGEWTCHMSGKAFAGLACGAPSVVKGSGKETREYRPFFCLKVQGELPVGPSMPCPDEVVLAETSRLNPFHPRLQTEAKAPDDPAPGVFSPLPDTRDSGTGIPVDPTLGYLEWVDELGADCLCADGSRPQNFPTSVCGQFPEKQGYRDLHLGWACDARRQQFSCVGRKTAPFDCAYSRARKVSPGGERCAEFAEAILWGRPDSGDPTTSLCDQAPKPGWDKSLANDAARSQCLTFSKQLWERDMQAPTMGACQDSCTQKIDQLCRKGR